MITLIDRGLINRARIELALLYTARGNAAASMIAQRSPAQAAEDLPRYQRICRAHEALKLGAK